MAPTANQGPAEDAADPGQVAVGLPASGLTRGIHLFVLASFAVAEPLFSLLKPGAAFFAVRRSQPVDLLVLVAALSLGLPLVLWLLQASLGRLRPVLGRAAFGGTVALLLTLVLAGPLVRALDQSPLVAGPLAVGLGLLGHLLYLRWKPARDLLSFLAPAPLVFAGLFLFHPSIARIRSAADPSDPLALLDGDLEDAPTVVMVVLDELPITSLMADESSIDASLFPNFARLAGDGTWFRNATTSHESTEHALPAILTGKRPVDRSLLPIAADHTRSVFTMLGGSHRMKIWETFTSLCPASLAGESFVGADPFMERMASLASDLTVVYAHIVLPPNLTSRLPSVTSNWSGFGGAAGGESPRDETPQNEEQLAEKKDRARVGRSEKFKEFVDSVDGDPTPTFYFLHLLTPHGPWNRMPSGRRYDDKPLPSAWAGGRWPATEAFAALAFQRHLMQLGQVDRMLGALLKRLKQTGVYDGALIMLVADHGINFTPSEYGRQAFPETVRKLAHVPLFIKRPFQKRGRISDRNVETIDLLPTIADVVGLDLPWAVDGVSAFSKAPARTQKTVYRRLEPLLLDGALPASWPELERKREWFGERAGWEAYFAPGAGRQWIGRPVGELDLTPQGSATATFRLDRADDFTRVDRSSTYIPCHVIGSLVCQAPPQRVVVALNGIVRATGYTFPPAGEPGGDRVPFAAMIPAARLRDGKNSVRIFGVASDGRLFELTQEGS